MSRHDVDLVRRAWDAFARGDADEATAVFAPDVVFDVSRDIWGAMVGGGVYHGHSGMVAWLGDLYSAWDRFEMTAEEVFETDDGRVVSVLYARGRGRTSGIEVEHRPAGVATVSGGKVTRLVWFPSRDEALEAIAAGG